MGSGREAWPTSFFENGGRFVIVEGEKVGEGERGESEKVRGRESERVRGDRVRGREGERVTGAISLGGQRSS